MGLADLTAEAVQKAITEFDRIGRDLFLRNYGFGEAREYYVVQNGRFYDSKAIAGAAHGHLPGQQPLRANEFAGGDATVRRTLERLGFVVEGPDSEGLPAPGEVLTNDEITRRFAVGNMGGMRRSTRLKLLVLISDPYKGLYKDRWADKVLHYTGMGKEGDQELMSAQNRTLAGSRQSGIPIHLLEATDPKRYTQLIDDNAVPNPKKTADEIRSHNKGL